jgi:hypothetical protein
MPRPQVFHETREESQHIHSQCPSVIGWRGLNPRQVNRICIRERIPKRIPSGLYTVLLIPRNSSYVLFIHTLIDIQIHRRLVYNFPINAQDISPLQGAFCREVSLQTANI